MKSIQQKCASIISSRDDPSTNWRGHAAGYLDKRSTFLESTRKSSPVPHDKSVVMKVPLARDSSASQTAYIT